MLKSESNQNNPTYPHGKTRCTGTCGTCNTTHILDDRVETCPSCGWCLSELKICKDCSGVCKCGYAETNNATYSQ